MTPNPSPDARGDRRWDDLVQRARPDSPAPIALAALLHAVQAAHGVVAGAPAAPTFLAEFAALFASRRALLTCSAAALACAALTGWQTWSAWQDLGPWAEFAAATWEIGL